MANLFFDFDGTIIDSQTRLYELFCELCPESQFSYEEYWELKRNRISQKEMLQKYFAYDDNKVKEFHQKWLDKVEDPKRLQTDKPICGIIEVLEKLLIKHNLYIVTNRQDKNLAIKEASSLNLSKYFKDILVTEQKQTKLDLILPYLTENDVLIGDTGEDIKDAKTLGIKSVAVSWGILSRHILQEYNPDIILDEVDDFDKCSFL